MYILQVCIQLLFNYVKSSPLNVSRLKACYIKLLPTGITDWLKCKVTQFVRLALVEKEDVTLKDAYLNDLTGLTLQGDIDKILKKKEPLGATFYDWDEAYKYARESNITTTINKNDRKTYI